MRHYLVGFATIQHCLLFLVCVYFCVLVSLGLLVRVYLCRVSFNFVTTNLTRMLAINVSIPNLSVARLEQFRPPYNYKTRDSDQQT